MLLDPLAIEERGSRIFPQSVSVSKGNNPMGKNQGENPTMMILHTALFPLSLSSSEEASCCFLCKE